MINAGILSAARLSQLDPNGVEYPVPSNLPETHNITYWFAADHGVYADADKLVPCRDGQLVRRWDNLGTNEDAEQPTFANRPIFRTGGAGGRPYIEARAGMQQYFNDLAISMPSGFTAYGTYHTTAFVVEINDLSLFPFLLGSTVSDGGKVGVYFRPTTNEQFHYHKAQWRADNLRVGPNAVVFMAGTPSVGDFRRNINGTYTVGPNSTSNANSTAISATQFLRCTGSGAGNNGYFDGKLYEIITWASSTGFTEANIEVMNAYLRTKYGITDETP